MKKTMISMAVALLFTTAATAQDNTRQRPERRMDKTEMAKMRTERMTQELGLNDKQQEQLLKLNTEFADKMPMRGPRGPRHGQDGHGRQGNPQKPDIDAQTGASPQAGAPDMKRERPSQEQMEARRKEMQANREAYQNELKKILTEEQMAKYQEAEKQRMDRRGHREGGRR